MKEKEKALIIVVVFFALALSARLLLIHQRPLHHDEGVNGYFVSNIMEEKGWKYNPENYHGPTLFYITALSFWLFGGSVFALRIVPVLFGSMLVLLPYLLRKKLGLKGIAVSSFALAFSPALMYYSMFAIHEILFAFFSIASLVLLLKFVEEKKNWMLYLGTVSLALLFTTKEASFFIGPFILILCILFAFLKGKNVLKAIMKNKVKLSVAVLIFYLIYSSFFTSFYSNPRGLSDSVKTLELWGPRVIGEKGHDKPFFYYSELLFFSESILLLGGIAGIAFAVWNKNLLFGLIGGFFLVSLLGISAVPYKTPWIIVNFLPALALLFGFFGKKILGYKKRVKIGFLSVLVIGFGLMVWSAYSINVLMPAREENKLSYVQTTQEAGRILETVVEKDGKIGLLIESGSQWPLPWLLRKENVFYLGEERLEDTDFLNGFNSLILDKEKGETVEKQLVGFEKKGFKLRPGMNLTAFLKK